MKIKLSLAIFLGLFLFLLSLPAPAQAYSYMTTDEVNEDTVIKAIEDKQDFSKISCQKVVELVSHFMEDTGGYDLVPNGYGSSWGSDSRFSTDLITSKQGCYHYAEFVSKSIYGSEEADEIIRLRNDYENYTVEGIRSFIEEEAQAGEHLRIDYLHSMVYLASNYKGIYTLQYYGRWEEPFLSYMTYDYLVDLLWSSGAELDLYNYESYKNGDPSEINGWIVKEGKRFFFRNGQALSGWQKIDGNWHYLSKDGNKIIES